MNHSGVLSDGIEHVEWLLNNCDHKDLSVNEITVKSQIWQKFGRFLLMSTCKEQGARLNTILGIHNTH